MSLNESINSKNLDNYNIFFQIEYAQIKNTILSRTTWTIQDNPKNDYISNNSFNYM